MRQCCACNVAHPSVTHRYWACWEFLPLLKTNPGKWSQSPVPQAGTHQKPAKQTVSAIAACSQIQSLTPHLNQEPYTASAAISGIQRPSKGQKASGRCGFARPIPFLPFQKRCRERRSRGTDSTSVILLRIPVSSYLGSFRCRHYFGFENRFYR